MIDITVFDIPIYLISERKYNNKITKRCETDIRKLARSEDEYRGELSHCISSYKSIYPWRYNLIVGALRISITDEESIELGLYFIDETKTTFNSNVKHYIKECDIPDRRIKKILTLNKTDEEIKEELIWLIEDTIKNYVNNGSHEYYVDMELFNNIIDFINLKDIVVEINS